MTSGANPTPSGSAAAETAKALGRRQMLRGGAILAGAATGAAVVALRPQGASADDGDNLVLGTANTASSETSVTIDAGITSALALENADGPALRTNVLDHTWAGQLLPGEIAGTALGPIVGVDVPDGPTTTFLVTGVDLANVATPFAATPRRILDLRTEAGRAAIIRRSASDALAADGKLRANQWIDISVTFTGPDFILDAVFANLTVVQAARGGFAVLYAPGVKPPTSTLNFAPGQVVANAAFVGAGTVMDHHAVRLSTSTDAWFLVDVTGGVTRGSTLTPLAQTATARTAGGRTALVSKLRKALGRTD
jgi:hypothetical protein